MKIAQLLEVTEPHADMLEQLKTLRDSMKQFGVVLNIKSGYPRRDKDGINVQATVEFSVKFVQASPDEDELELNMKLARSRLAKALDQLRGDRELIVDSEKVPAGKSSLDVISREPIELKSLYTKATKGGWNLLGQFPSFQLRFKLVDAAPLEQHSFRVRFTLPRPNLSSPVLTTDIYALGTLDEVKALKKAFSKLEGTPIHWSAGDEKAAATRTRNSIKQAIRLKKHQAFVDHAVKLFNPELLTTYNAIRSSATTDNNTYLMRIALSYYIDKTARTSKQVPMADLKKLVADTIEA